MNRYAAALILLTLGQVAFAQTKPDNNISPKTRIYEPKYLVRERAGQVANFVQSVVGEVSVRWEPVVNGLVITYVAPRNEPGDTLDRAEALIKRFDVPEPAPKPERQIEMTVYLVRAWTDANRPQGTIPPELATVVKEMKGAMPYTGFSLADTIVTIPRDGLALQDAMPSSVTGSSAPYFYSLSFRGTRLLADGKTFQVGDFRFAVKVPLSSPSGTTFQEESITTPLTIQEGQKMVLGKIKLRGDDLFVVLSYKLK